jgi:membrane associated rhomboid family serine protease
MLFNVAFIAFTGIFVLANVDNFAHLGGFVAGAVYGFLQIPRDLHKDPREVGETTKFIGIAALGITVVVSVFSILILLRVI